MTVSTPEAPNDLDPTTDLRPPKVRDRGAASLEEVSSFVTW